MPTVQHFEIPADDIKRAQEFYKKVFGWSMQKTNNPENPEKDYWHFETQDDDGNKGLSGGMMKRQAPEHTVTNYITVSSIEQYQSKIEQNGGKIMIKKTEIPNMGYFAIFTDSEDNMFGLFELAKI
jgi:predicted enzyme related to lactoylglutathione lyase